MARKKPRLGVNSKPTAKRKPRGKPFTGRDDPRVNLKGAPKRGESWTEIIKRYGEMTPIEAARESRKMFRKLASIGDGVTLKQAVVLRVYASLLTEPQPGLLNAFLDRAEGKIAQPLEHGGPGGGPIQTLDMEAVRRKRWADAAPILAAAGIGWEAGDVAGGDGDLVNEERNDDDK